MVVRERRSSASFRSVRGGCVQKEISTLNRRSSPAIETLFSIGYKTATRDLKGYIILNDGYN